MQAFCSGGRTCSGLRRPLSSRGVASRHDAAAPPAGLTHNTADQGGAGSTSATPRGRRVHAVPRSPPLPLAALPAHALQSELAFAADGALSSSAVSQGVGRRAAECGELAGLMEELNSTDKARKLTALNAIIDQQALLLTNASVQVRPVPQLVDSVTKQLSSSWVAGGNDVAALAAEALCSVLAAEAGSEELEAAAVRSVRPLLQLLSSCAMQQPRLQGAALPAAFFAASALVRAASWPAAVEEALQQGAPGVLLKLLQPSQPQLLQVAVYALFKLFNGCERPVEARQQLLVGGGLPMLCTALWGAPGGVPAADGATAEMLFSVLMDAAACPRVQQAAAAAGDAAAVVRALQHAAAPAGRLQAVLVLCRLTCHSSECQLACLQAGAVPTVVALMESGECAEKAHAARLAAILAQHPAGHEAFRSANVMRPLVMMLRAEDETGAEQAASVAAVLAHNPGMHGHMLLCNLLPALLPLLDGCGSNKAKGYVLSTLLLLAMSEGRHAMHLVREGAVARLVAVAKQEADAHLVEYSAAVLGQLSRCLQVQPEVVGGGAIPSLVQLLRVGSPDARAHAAEALAHLASPTPVRKRLIARAGVLGPLGEMLAQAHPESRYWASNLLQVLSQEPSVLGEMSAQGLCRPLVQLLAARPTPPHHSESELLQAQAQACWVMVRLAGHPQAGAQQQLKDAGAVPLLMRLVRTVQPTGARVAAQLDALEHNTHAAAMAALLALRSSGAASTMELLQAAAVQHWCGHVVRLHGLTAADPPLGH